LAALFPRTFSPDCFQVFSGLHHEQAFAGAAAFPHAERQAVKTLGGVPHDSGVLRNHFNTIKWQGGQSSARRTIIAKTARTE
jgi:hypothetical protein